MNLDSGQCQCGKQMRHTGSCKGERRGGKKPSDPIERFWPKVERKGDGDCWPWLGALNNHGYGRFSIESGPIYAHRFSYMEHVAPIPDGMHVLHRCDNPKCVNPAHLFLGTQKDNMHDMHNKARHPTSPNAPRPTQCHECGHWAAEAVCSLCKAERPAFTALKNITRKALDVKPSLPPCRYAPNALCGCDGRGLCLETA